MLEAEQVLSDIIGERDIQNMTVSEAQKLVNAFYLSMEIQAVGFYDSHKMDYLCNKALKRHGLEFLAVS